MLKGNNTHQGSMKKEIRIGRSLMFIIVPMVFTIYGLVEAKNFLYPLAFGLLFSYLLFPIANYLEKKHFPRIIANLVCIILALVVLGVGISFIIEQVENMLGDFPTLKRKAIDNVESLQHNLEDLFGVSSQNFEIFMKERINNFFNTGTDLFRDVFASTTGTIVRLALLPVYIFLFLYYRTKFALFILKIVPRNKQKVTINILRDISTVASKYMGGVVIVVFILCILNSLGLYIVGFRYPIVLGIISALFNFIPYFGTLMGGAVPLLFALLIQDPLIAGRVVILFIIIQFIENNILTPNIVGGNVKISPFFIIVGLVMAAMIWGIPGMLVIIPFLAILKIVFKNIDELKPYAFLLSTRGTQKHSISMKNLRKIGKIFGNFFKKGPVDSRG